MARNLPQQLRYDKLGPNVVKALTKRHFEAYYCSTKEEALAQAIKLIPEKMLFHGEALFLLMKLIYYPM